MRLWELFSDLNERNLKDIERDLDSQVYQPAEKVLQGKPVIDLDLLSSPHFIQRVNQRAGNAGVSPEEVEDLFRAGREKFKVEIGQASRKDNFQDTGSHIDFYDPKTKLMVPTIVQPNPNCKPNSRGKVVCQTPNGTEPKNRLVAKTMFRKGVDD